MKHLSLLLTLASTLLNSAALMSMDASRESDSKVEESAAPAAPSETDAQAGLFAPYVRAITNKSSLVKDHTTNTRALKIAQIAVNESDHLASMTQCYTQALARVTTFEKLDNLRIKICSFINNSLNNVGQGCPANVGKAVLEHFKKIQTPFDRSKSLSDSVKLMTLSLPLVTLKLLACLNENLDKAIAGDEAFAAHVTACHEAIARGEAATYSQELNYNFFDSIESAAPAPRT